MYYYPFHINDFKAATTHLNDEEELAYRRLLDMYYETEMPIPLDTHRVGKRVRSRVEVVEYILDEFFTKNECGFVSKRCAEVISAYQRQVKGGKEGALKRWNNKALIGTQSPTHTLPIGTPMGEGIATNNQEPITNNKKIRSTEPTVPVGFDGFWDAYDKKVGKVKAISEWKKLKPNEELVGLILKQARAYSLATEWKYRKDPERWLKGRHWEDDFFGSGVRLSSTDDIFAGAK